MTCSDIQFKHTLFWKSSQIRAICTWRSSGLRHLFWYTGNILNKAGSFSPENTGYMRTKWHGFISQTYITFTQLQHLDCHKKMTPWLALTSVLIRDKIFLPFFPCFAPVLTVLLGRNIAVGTATRYGLDGSGIESRWGWDFPHAFTLLLGPTQPPIQWVLGLSQGVKRPGRVVDYPLPASAAVKERPSWPRVWWVFDGVYW